MKLAIVMMVMACGTTTFAAPDAARLRARAALALTVAESVSADTDYPERYGQAVRAGKPLLVWVGQPARCVPGCVCHEAAAFPGIADEAVVVGLPTGGPDLRRVDLLGRPDDGMIRKAITTPSVDAVPLALRPRMAGP